MYSDLHKRVSISLVKGTKAGPVSWFDNIWICGTSATRESCVGGVLLYSCLFRTSALLIRYFIEVRTFLIKTLHTSLRHWSGHLSSQDTTLIRTPLQSGRPPYTCMTQHTAIKSSEIEREHENPIEGCMSACHVNKVPNIERITNHLNKHQKPS